MENRVIQEIKNNFVYCRSLSPDQINLTQKYIDAHTINGHNVKKVKLYGKLALSGLNAIYLTMSSLVNQEKQQCNIVISNELYCDTPKIIKSFGCNVSEIDVTLPNSIVSHFEHKLDRTKTNILFFESSSNPNGNIFPFEILPKLRSLSKKLYVVVDNTWLTHVVFNPFTIPDIDICVNSCSKYYSAGECISGMIITKHQPVMANIEQLSKLMGQHISVDYCKILLSKIDSIQSRIESSNRYTIELTKILKTYKSVEWVRNSSSQDDPSYELAKKYYNKDNNGQALNPSVINIRVNKPIGEVKQLLLDNNIINQTSFGSSRTKICNFIKSFSPTTTDLRISVGYEIFDLNMFSFLNK